MRASELFGKQVLDPDGRRLGEVRDIRVAEEVEAAPGHPPRWRVDGLVVGNAGLAERLGYAYGDVQGPWPFSAIMRRVACRARYLEWGDVVRVDEEAVHAGRTDLPSAQEFLG